MSQRSSLLNSRCYKYSIASIILITALSAHAAPTVTAVAPSGTPPVADLTDRIQPIPHSTAEANNTLAAQLQPSNQALSAANQELLSRNAQLQRQVNDLQTQVNVLIYESKGQLFLYGAFTVLIGLSVGIFMSWLLFGRRARW